MLKLLILTISMFFIVGCSSTNSNSLEEEIYEESKDEFKFKTHQLTEVYWISPLFLSSKGIKKIKRQSVETFFHFSQFIYEAKEIKVTEAQLTFLDGLLKNVFLEKNTDFISKIDGRYSGDLLFVFEKKTELPNMPEETYIMLNRTSWKYIGSIGWDKFNLNKDITDKIYNKIKKINDL